MYLRLEVTKPNELSSNFTDATHEWKSAKRLVHAHAIREG